MPASDMFQTRLSRRAVVRKFFVLPAVFLLLAAGEARAERPTLVFGIVPQQSASRLAQEWIPLLNHLGLQTGLKLVFATAKDIPTFESCLSQGAYDIAYMNPYHYTVFHQAPGYVAFSRQAKRQLRGLIVVRKDSSIKALRDLNGLTVAFPSPAAFGASVIPRAEMKAAGIAIEPRYVVSHDSVYRAVAAGLVPAGGGVARTLAGIDPQVRDQLRVIYETKGYTPHAFAAHPRVTQSAVLAIGAAMVDVATTEPALLKPLGMTGFRSARDRDWDSIRALKLTRAQTQISTGMEALCRSD
jgi:phosphate/phosphite/phosphonate ABC transporter binding protein